MTETTYAGGLCADHEYYYEFAISVELQSNPYMGSDRSQEINQGKRSSNTGANWYDIRLLPSPSQVYCASRGIGDLE